MAKKSNAHLMPIDVTERTWLYSERGYLLVVHQVVRDDGAVTSTQQIKLPWRFVELAIKVRSKPRARK